MLDGGGHKKKENSLNTAIRCVVLVLPTFSKTPGSWPPVGAEYRSNQGGFLQFLLNETRGPENLLLKVHSLKTNSQFAPENRPIVYAPKGSGIVFQALIFRESMSMLVSGMVFFLLDLPF